MSSPGNFKILCFHLWRFGTLHWLEGMQLPAYTETVGDNSFREQLRVRNRSSGKQHHHGSKTPQNAKKNMQARTCEGAQQSTVWPTGLLPWQRRHRWCGTCPRPWLPRRCNAGGDAPNTPPPEAAAARQGGTHTG